MNEKRIEEIKQNLRQIMQQIAEMGEEPPPEIQELLMQVIEKSQTQIQELRQEEQGVEAPTLQAPIHHDVEMLWTLAGQDPQAFISYLRTYPTKATEALLSNPTQMNATIEQLQRIQPGQEKPPLDGIQPIGLQSSNIWGTQYNPKSGKMRVKFQGGSVYEYDGVPQNIYKAFVTGNASAKTDGSNKYGKWWKGKSPSAGASMNQYIKAGAFPYRRLS